MKIWIGLLLLSGLTFNMAFATCVETVVKDPQVVGGVIKTIKCDGKESDERIKTLTEEIAQLNYKKSYQNSKIDEEIVLKQKELDDLVNAKK